MRCIVSNVKYNVLYMYMYMYMYIHVHMHCMLGTKHGFVQTRNCPAQSVDLRFVLAMHGLMHNCTILGCLPLDRCY